MHIGFARRSEACLLAAAVAAPLCALPARAEFPDRTVKIVVPFDAGGTVDAVARALAQPPQRQMGRAGHRREPARAPATPSARRRSPRRRPDGYTLLFANTSVSVNPSLFKSLPYDTLRDLAPVLYLSPSPNVLLAQKSLGTATLAALIALAQVAPRTSAELRLGGARQRAPFLHGTAAERGRHRAAARSLSRRRAGGAGGHARRGRSLLQRHTRRARPAARRQGGAARDHQPETLPCPARHSADRRAGTAELRGDRLRRHHGHRRHAARGRGQAQQRRSTRWCARRNSPSISRLSATRWWAGQWTPSRPSCARTSSAIAN